MLTEEEMTYEFVESLKDVRFALVNEGNIIRYKLKVTSLPQIKGN